MHPTILVLLFTAVCKAAYDVQECVSLNPLPSVCVGFAASTCSQYSLRVNLTVDGSPLFAYTVSDLGNSRQCSTDASGDCQRCIQFKSLTMAPGYVKACPQIETRCSSIFNVPIRTDLQCIELGADCTALTSCSACTDSPYCGWCGTASTRHCVARGIDQPLCDSCANSAGGRNAWWVSPAECPSVEDAARSHASWAHDHPDAVAGIAVGVLAALLLLICVPLYCYRLRRNLSTKAAPRRFEPLGSPGSEVESERRTTAVSDADASTEYYSQYSPPAPSETSGQVLLDA